MNRQNLISIVFLSSANDIYGKALFYPNASQIYNPCSHDLLVMSGVVYVVSV